MIKRKSNNYFAQRKPVSHASVELIGANDKA